MIIGAIATYGFYDSSWPFITDLNCTGDEATLLDCPYNGLPDYNCPRRHDASIICRGKSLYIHASVYTLNSSGINTPMSDCNDGDIRLEGGQTEYEGRVEMCLNKAWGTVCSNYNFLTQSSWYWDSRESNVVCRQLGHMELGKC